MEQIISDLAELKAKVDQKDDQIRDLKAEIADLKVNFRIYFTHWDKSPKTENDISDENTVFENHPKFSNFCILAFSTNFCPIKIGLSGNTV